MDYYDLIFAKKLNGGGGGGGSGSRESKPIKDINFFDYDGTCVYSYTKQEWAEMEDLPPVPTHEGLTGNGWTYSSKAEVDQWSAYYYEPLNVGALYYTNSGMTEIDIQLIAPVVSPTISLCPNGSVEVDWGDGSSVGTLSGTSLTTVKTLSHTYSSSGNYTIKLKAVNNGAYNLGASTGANSNIRPLLSWSTAVAIGNVPRAYPNSIIAVRLPKEGVKVSASAFATCCSMKYFTVPYKSSFAGNNTISYASNLKMSNCCYGQYAYYYASSLKFVCIRVTAYNSSFFECSSLPYVNLSTDTPSIDTSAFQFCRSLMLITIPDSVTDIGSNAFNNCRSLRYIHMKGTTPPTLNASALSTGLSSLTNIYVPYSEDHSVLNAYQTATNWSTYASKIVEEPQ